MNRRQLLQSLSIGLTSTIALPIWANAWKKSELAEENNLTQLESEILANLVEAIIPKTSTKGAKELGVDRFVSLMVKDCYESSINDLLKSSLTAINELSKSELSKSIAQADLKSTQNLLLKYAKLGKSEQQMVEIIKQNTILGYLNSEYVMTELRIYKMIPGKYIGEVKI